MLPAAVGAQRRVVRDTSTLRIAFVRDDSVASGAVLSGVRFGADEAARTAALLGAPVPQLLVVRGDAIPADAAVLIAGDHAACARLLESERAADALVLLAGCADAPPSRGCVAHAFRLAAPGADALLWHPALEAFGAAQLNDRFLRWAGEPMTSGAWAGWMSVKVASEAAMRAASTTGSALVAYLAARGTRFDGHKGVAMSFDDAHVLSGPIYDAHGKPAPSPQSPAGARC